MSRLFQPEEPISHDPDRNQIAISPRNTTMRVSLGIKHSETDVMGFSTNISRDIRQRPASTRSSHAKTGQRPLVLASRSPRREQLLRDAGFAFEVLVPDVDDANLQRGAVDPETWVQALAYFKAMGAAHKIDPGRVVFDQPVPRCANTLRAIGSREPVVLGADTVCVHANRIIGKPTDARDAATMMRRFADTSHEVLTGVALLDLETQSRVIFSGRSCVGFGPLTDTQINQYIESGDWQGKAGGYNLTERLADGWMIDVQGDPTNVVGLPMEQLVCRLSKVGVRPAAVELHA